MKYYHFFDPILISSGKEYYHFLTNSGIPRVWILNGIPGVWIPPPGLNNIDRCINNYSFNLPHAIGPLGFELCSLLG